MKNGSTIKSYEDLIAWQKARALVATVYRMSDRFPKTEIYGLTNQMRRASVSVASNIAEGYGRGSLPDYVRFLSLSRGSLYELETQATLANDLGFLSQDAAVTMKADIREASRILQGLIASLNQHKNKPSHATNTQCEPEA